MKHPRRAFNKDKIALTVSILALIVSVVSPFVNYRWLNQVERDDKDRKQVFAWMATDSYPKLGKDGLDSIETDYVLWIRKTGSLAVGNVQFLLQCDASLKDSLQVTASSEIELEPLTIESGGRVRIRLKHPLPPTAHDIKIQIHATESIRSAYGKSDTDALTLERSLTTLPVEGAWLFTDAIAGSPISVPGVTRRLVHELAHSRGFAVRSATKKAF